MTTDRTVALWILGDLLRHLRQQRIWWWLNGGPSPDISLREWWDR